MISIYSSHGSSLRCAFWNMDFVMSMGAVGQRIRKFQGKAVEAHGRNAKREILSHYKINICLENTIIPHYVTEKLWDAILGACLPIYHGSDNRIYDTFPRKSFIEASGKSIEELASEVINMSSEEMDARYAACLRAYLDACKQDWQLSHDAYLVRTLSFLRSILQ